MFNPTSKIRIWANSFGRISLICIGGLLLAPWLTTAQSWGFGPESLSDFLASQLKLSSEYASKKYQTTLSEQQLPTDIFWKNRRDYELKKRTAILQGINTTKLLLAQKYENCALSSEELSSILFFLDKTFAENLRNRLDSSLLPTRAHYQNSCKKLTSCFEGATNLNLNKKCEDIVYQNYLLGLEQEERKLLVQESNLGNDRYQNGSLEDSSYDLLHDLWEIARILFEDPKVFGKELSSLLFYRLPSTDPSVSNSSWATLWNWSAAGMGTASWLFLWINQGNGWSFGATTGFLGGTSTLWVTTDSEINAFIQGNHSNLSPTQVSSAFINYCSIVGSPLLEEANTFAEEQGFSPLEVSEQELENQIVDILQNSTLIQQASPSQFPAGNQNIAENAISSDPNLIASLKKQLENCTNTCNQLKKDERHSCKMQCLCAEYISPALPKGTVFHFLQEGALKLRICTIPSENKIATIKTTTKSFISIESLISAIQDIITALYESGELTSKVKPREFLDTSLANVNFSKQVSFVLGHSFKTPLPAKNQQQEKKSEEHFNTTLKEDLFQTETQGRNRYLVIQKPTNWGVATQNQSTLVNSDIQSPSLALTLGNERIASSSIIIDDFLSQNINFLLQLNASILEMEKYLTILKQKK